MERQTLRRDDTLENELRVLDMMVNKVSAARKRAEKRQAAQLPLPSPPPREDVADIGWLDNAGFPGEVDTVDRPFEMPPLWDGTASPMPEASNFFAWQDLVSNLAIEESPYVTVSAFPGMEPGQSG